jgi:hypothetical protein
MGLYGQSFQETIITAQVDGGAVTAAAATSLLPASAKAVIPANTWAIGKRLRVRAAGRISSVITTPGTARFDIRMGATVVFDGLAILLDSVAAHTNVGWRLEIELTCRAIGTTANFMGVGTWMCEDILGVPATAPKGVLTAILPWNTAPVVGANFDSTTSQIVDLFFTQTVATGSCTLHQYELSIPN